MKKIAYIDVDNLAYEGIKSGATIGNVQILKGFKEKEIEPVIYKIYNEKDSNLDRNSTEIKVFSEIENIPVISKKFILYDIEEELKLKKYDFILYSIPSVFFERKDCELMKILYKYSRKLILVMADNLYPNSKTINDNKIYDEYVEILRNSKVITLSKFLKNEVKKELNVESDVVYPKMEINSHPSLNMENKKYVTFINPVEVKGIRLFERVVDKNPDIDFLIVRGWEETKNYTFERKNVKILDFQKNVNKVWEITKMLLVLSTWHEVYGRVVSEAIMNNCQVICNKIGGIPEAANGMAILVEPLRNYGSETKQIFDEEELEQKSDEISSLMRKGLSKINEKELKEKSNKMVEYINKNNNYLYEYIENIKKEMEE